MERCNIGTNLGQGSLYHTDCKPQLIMPKKSIDEVHKRGIRYAFKPNRFEKSIQMVPLDGQIDATQYGSQCPQLGTD